jgi:hypothetical protein
VIAPGGKPVTTCVPHKKIARAHKTGVALYAEYLKRWNGFVLKQNSSSTVETFIEWARSRCQRYWVKATAMAPRIANPKALDIMFDAVTMYD